MTGARTVVTCPDVPAELLVFLRPGDVFRFATMRTLRVTVGIGVERHAFELSTQETISPSKFRVANRNFKCTPNSSSTLVNDEN